MRGYFVIILLILYPINSFSAQTANPPALERATFAGGCFWCMEPPFDKLKGVVSTVSGYAGGTQKNPTYQQVSSGKTQYVEVVQITFNPEEISYQKLLDVFWRNIDPFDNAGQFCDKGSQYRSKIFFHNNTQKQFALESKAKIEKEYKPVFTEVVEFTTFYPAEEYHQNYYKKNPIRYKFYRYNCKRDKRLKAIWEKTS